MKENPMVSGFAGENRGMTRSAPANIIAASDSARDHASYYGRLSGRAVAIISDSGDVKRLGREVGEGGSILVFLAIDEFRRETLWELSLWAVSANIRIGYWPVEVDIPFEEARRRIEINWRRARGRGLPND